MASAQGIIQVLKTAAKSIPWKKIAIEVVPIVIASMEDRIKKLIERIKAGKEQKTKPPTLIELDTRLKELEQININIGSIVPELQNKQQLVSDAIHTLSARILVLLLVSGLALVTSIIAVILALKQ